MQKIKNLLKKQGFTLVELIIVIAIIAVLAVAAFMMLTKWLGKSRDSRRLGDMATIKKALEVTYSDTDRGLNMYPSPTDEKDILDGSGVVMWNQGVFGLDTIAEMDNMQKAPQDPGDQSYYKYSVTLDKKEFQLGTVLEDGGEITENYRLRMAENFGNNVSAAAGEARLDGNYDGYVSYPTTGGTMIFKTPSLLVKGEAKIELFSGTVENLMLNGEEEGTPIVLRSVKTDPDTSAEEVATALGIDEKSASVVLKKETGAVVTVAPSNSDTGNEEPAGPSLDCQSSADSCSSTSITACKDLIGVVDTSGEYWIDPDGAESISPFKVYCDMESDGGGWTRIFYVTAGSTEFGDYDSTIWASENLNPEDCLSGTPSGDCISNGFKNVSGDYILWKNITNDDYINYHLDGTLTSMYDMVNFTSTPLAYKYTALRGNYEDWKPLSGCKDSWGYSGIRDGYTDSEYFIRKNGLVEDAVFVLEKFRNPGGYYQGSRLGGPTYRGHGYRYGGMYSGLGIYETQCNSSYTPPYTYDIYVK